MTPINLKKRHERVTISREEWKTFCEVVFDDKEFSELLPMTFTIREVVLEATRVLKKLRGDTQ